MERHLIDETENQEIIAYKGSNQRIDGARFFRHEIGKTYEYEGRVEVYESGFEACEYPLHAFDHYPPADSRFFLVRQSGAIDRSDDDTAAIASERVTIDAELSLPELIARAVRWVQDRAQPAESSPSTGDRPRQRRRSAGLAPTPKTRSPHSASSSATKTVRFALPQSKPGRGFRRNDFAGQSRQWAQVKGSSGFFRRVATA